MHPAVMLRQGVVEVTRIKIVGAGLAGLMVLSVLVPAVASAGGYVHYRHYGGTTSQGGSVRVATFSDGTETWFRSINFFSVIFDCEDGTQLEYGGIGIGWGGRHYPMSQGRLDFDDVWYFQATHVHGRIGLHGGSGTFSVAVPELTADEKGAQLCTTGELTWQVQRTAAKGASLPSADVATRITVGADGTTRTMTTSGDGTTRTTITSGTDGTTRTTITSGAKTAAGTARLRHYRGRTSQAGAMHLTTAKVDSTIKPHELFIEWTLGCEDGTELGPWGTHYGGWTLSQARLGLDWVWELEAAHIHGRLGTHTGSGTASDAVAVLTADEQAMFCTTGDLTWRLWRTDAGARPIVP